VTPMSTRGLGLMAQPSTSAHRGAELSVMAMPALSLTVEAAMRAEPSPQAAAKTTDPIATATDRARGERAPYRVLQVIGSFCGSGVLKSCGGIGRLRPT